MIGPSRGNAARVRRVVPIPATGSAPKSFDSVDLDAPPVTVSYRLSEDLVLSDPEPRVGWWDESGARWRTDGVSDVRVEKGVLTYTTVKLGHLSLLQSRSEYIPYTSWGVRPSASGEACVVSIVPETTALRAPAWRLKSAPVGARCEAFPSSSSRRSSGRSCARASLASRRAGVRITPDDRSCASVGKDPKDEKLELEILQRCRDAGARPSRWRRASSTATSDRGDALVRVAVGDFDLVSGEDVFKIFQREREGVVLSLLRKTKGIAVVDARHKLARFRGRSRHT